ncbi:MAG: response regulator transcription factor [Hyphomicrobium sp.]|nr:response regulator transcription factor [Hyphomicrobium sp.]
MSDVVTFIVADDHPMVRRGVTTTLHDEDDFRVVAEAASAPEALALAVHHRPRVVILDVNMPGSGLEAARAIKAGHPEIHAVMYSFRQDAEVISASIAAGASGYVIKGAPGTALIAALRDVLAGKPFVRIDRLD